MRAVVIKISPEIPALTAEAMVHIRFLGIVNEVTKETLQKGISTTHDMASIWGVKTKLIMWGRISLRIIAELGLGQ